MIETSLADRLRRLIASAGPIPVSLYMAEANAAYYGTRDPLGRDFITAPEVSQMFGELVGLWIADLWSRAGAPPVRYVELGPGRGTLAADAARAMRAAALAPPVHFVETSPTLRAAQAERVPGATWHDRFADIPGDEPLLVVANEFFDALPIRQFVRGRAAWHERLVTIEGERFLPAAGPSVPDAAIPESLRGADEGSVLEVAPMAAAVIGDIADAIAARGGAALVFDYGHVRTGLGDTLQAVAANRYADPWVAPGDQDLTAHVDFQALGDAARRERVSLFGPTTQGAWLSEMGIDVRTEALSRAAPGRSPEIASARDRLVSPRQMGALFKAMAFVAEGWPQPAGF
ncbi:class I SAM-dependent methyltransferase [Sphingosinicella sp. BN140058]|uniref:class I SAM-dependent methyltransferase n=1 Tax=Sphingosinicella sp. BN140058 TaxID=1892855 RepID=UPI001FB134FB|nr:SAM-dependent methyltransferase [Sphingosinicella sp. BN140058]